MSYSLNHPIHGRIDYYSNDGFDYIAQRKDQHGIMFCNYTKERIELETDDSNMVAIFHITKRKTKANKVYYLVYNNETLVIHRPFEYMCKEITALLKKHSYLKYINTSHPKTKHILNSINTINGTNY